MNQTANDRIIVSAQSTERCFCNAQFDLVISEFQQLLIHKLRYVVFVCSIPDQSCLELVEIIGGRANHEDRERQSNLFSADSNNQPNEAQEEVSSD
jgi:hypothetical protein